MAVTVEALKGRMLDADSHLQVPPKHLDEALGPVFAGMLRQFWARMASARGTSVDQLNPIQGRPEPPTAENVWTAKMNAAAGAFDPAARLQTLDLMGVDRQLMFPMAVPASMMLSKRPEAFDVSRHHNDYVLDWAKDGNGRLRPVAVINMNEVQPAIDELERVIGKGAYAVNIGCGRPPAGLSPADAAWEPFWARLEEAGVPVLFHIGGEVGFVDPAWGATPNLRPSTRGSQDPLDGETVSPYTLTAGAFAPANYLATLILDGVLERHPGLRLGAIEMTAQWVGPLAEVLDQRFEVFSRLRSFLSMRPSEYINRQVRVTPFWWEPVGKYLERFGLEDVYVFSTDFPHVEGGTEPVQRFWASLDGHSDEVYEKFFVTNAALII
ncbi:MAG TPA: amidohydrolase family protein [Acidimicrobiales bacterium]|nr:amidohydrolase family protein [Acidimicrobiales bacterium]